MLLWTIQDQAMMDAAYKRGYLKGDHRYIFEEEFRDAYAWMRKQMQRRIKVYRGGWPIWAWANKPDLRERWASYGDRGAKYYLLTLNISEERVLLSDFQAWHFVLNKWFLALSKREEDSWRPKNEDHLTRTEQARMEKSWERIFDLKALSKSPLFEGDYWDKAPRIQAVIERVELPEIIKIREFISR